MFQKSVSALLIILLIFAGLLGAYIYTLNQQLIEYQEEQRLAFGTLNDRLSGLDNSLDNLRDRFAASENLTVNRLDDLETETADILSQLESLEDELGTIAEFSRSQIDTRQVYAQASQATVRIGDGERVFGSGFIYDTAGHVLTASHVVEGLGDIYITLPDGRISKASLVGTNLRSDVAVLKLRENLMVIPLKLADSDQVVIGDPVAIIGNPLGTTESVTSGIVSQKGRFVEIEGDFGTQWIANIIQFDSAANFGNSGGPLLNSRGEVLGIVTARVDPERGEGIYFAVSSNKINRVANALIEKGNFDYPWLGIAIADIIPLAAESWDLKTINGVLVNEVLSDTPAETAGLEDGDIITAINGVSITEAADLQSYLGEHTSPDDVISITIDRDGFRPVLMLVVGTR